MMRTMKRVAVALLALVLAAMLLPGCGGGEEEGRVTIVIGEISDLTGTAAPALRTIHYALEDMSRYYNEEGLIPGVKIKVVSYDTRLNPAREVPGYEWVRGRGAKLVVSVLHTTGEILKPFAERDKVAIACLVTTKNLIEPPGWVFCFSNPGPWAVKTLMGWVSAKRWDYSHGIPKVGFGGWAEPGSMEIEKAMRQY